MVDAPSPKRLPLPVAPPRVLEPRPSQVVNDVSKAASTSASMQWRTGAAREALQAPSTAELGTPAALVDSALTREALREARLPAKTHTYRQYVEQLRTELTREGLPSDASDVPMLVLGESAFHDELGKHAKMVVEVLAGPLGFARKAKLGVTALRETSQGHRPSVPASSMAESAAVLAMAPTLKRLTAGQTPVAELGQAAATGMLESMLRVRQAVHDAMALAPKGRTSLANLSIATSVHAEVANVVRLALQAPRGSPLFGELTKTLGHEPTSADSDAIHRLVAHQVREKLKTPQLQQPLTASQRALVQSVAEARARGILIFKGAGNDRTEALRIGQPGDERPFDAVPGMVQVGAIDLGTNAHSDRDDSVAAWSVEGAVLGAVGVNVPLDKRNVEGTSFSSPFTMSIAGLMLKANPRLTPDHIEMLLKATSKPVRGGLNNVDVLSAVRAAKQFKTT